MEILKNIFGKGWECLILDLGRSMNLRMQGRISEDLWDRYVEAQVDMLMARGYEHLSDSEKYQMLMMRR